MLSAVSPATIPTVTAVAEYVTVDRIGVLVTFSEAMDQSRTPENFWTIEWNGTENADATNMTFINATQVRIWYEEIGHAPATVDFASYNLPPLEPQRMRDAEGHYLAAGGWAVPFP